MPGQPDARPLAALPRRRLRIVDVAVFYGERGGGITTYLEAKGEFARRTGAFEHHLVVPGRMTPQTTDPHRHERPSLRVAASNGYRIPIGSAGLRMTLRELAPDVVLIHDPYWTPRLICRVAHELGAAVVAVHHSSAALHAAGIPGPQDVYERALQRWFRRAYHDVDAVMAAFDPELDVRRPYSLRLRLGVDPAFAPIEGVTRGRHVLYVGRFSREKGLRELLEAAAGSTTPWPLRLLGTGPAGESLRERAQTLGIEHRVRFAPYVRDRTKLARHLATAGCVVLPGAHETFGLAALEAAACGTPVVTADRTPAVALLDGFVETFPAGDAGGLLAAIERARRRAPDPARAAALAEAHRWDRALAAELADIEQLIGRL